MTREEALNEIRSWAIPSEKGREVLETLIPELAESEDERMRKALIDGVRQIRCKNGITQEQMIAYLEKQKEKEKYDRMMPVYDNLDSFESALAKAWRAYNDSGARTVDGCEDDYVECAHAKGFREGYLFGIEKQKEQKEIPLMGRDTDAYFDDLRITTKPLTSREWFDEGIKYAQRLQKEQKPAEQSAKGRRGRIGSTPEHIRKKAENFLSKMEPPYDADDICSAYETGAMESTKQEWSEEDEKMLRTIISDGSRGVELDSKQISWLKSLRPQSKKELSIEKAIQWLDDTFYFLNNSSGRGRDCEITTHDFDSLEEMYDSFRKAVTVDSEPSWKPSEEQMEALKCAVADIARFSKRGGRQVELENEPYYSALHSLYCNLEKLV